MTLAYTLHQLLHSQPANPVSKQVSQLACTWVVITVEEHLWLLVARELAACAVALSVEGRVCQALVGWGNQQNGLRNSLQRMGGVGMVAR